MAGEARRYFTVSRITGRLTELLGPALAAEPFWVRAELSSAVERRGHLYADLVETRDGKVVAKLRCTVWSRDLERMRRRCREAGVELPLEDGAETGLLCALRFHPCYGLSLQGLDVDPEVALGELERRRRAVLERLASEGLLSRNGRLPDPPMPTRIGLVASRTSAAFEDFVQTLRASPYGFLVLHADATVQGPETERSVLAALDRLEALEPDLVVVVRGGGSRLDLSHLDNEAVARRIALSSRPVWTGIGHEIDRSVLDEVAARSFKTPTAAAEELVARLSRVDGLLADARRRLRTGSRALVAPEARRLASARDRLLRGALVALEGRRTRLEAARRTLATAPAGRLRLTSRELRTLGEGLLRASAGLLAGRQLRLAHLIQRLLRGSVPARLVAERARLSGRREACVRAARGRREVELERLSARRKSLSKTSGRALRARREALARSRQAFRLARYLERLGGERRRQQLRAVALRAADPKVLLGRGWALVFDEAGQLVRSVDGLAAGRRTSTRLADGTVRSIVEGTERSR